MGRILDKLSKYPFVLLALACASLFYLPLGLRALWDPDEGRIAEIAREMLELKDWAVPHLNYVIYFNKPPLMYWLTAATMRLLGPTPFAARFWCATLGLLTVGATYRWGKNWKSERVGLLAGGILATSLGFFALTQYMTLDMALTFWTTLTLFAGSGLLVERSVHRVRRLTYLAAVGIAGGVLSQGLVAYCLPFVVLLTVYWSQGRRIPVVKRPWQAAVILCALITFPWFIGVSLRHPIFPYYYLVQEHLSHYWTDAQQSVKPVYYFVPVAFFAFLPWSVFLPKVFQTWFAHRHAALQRDPEGAVMVAWVCFVFLFVSLARHKLAGSILPIFPALALLIAHEFDEVLGDPDEPNLEAMPPWVGRGLAGLIALLALALLVLKLPPSILAIDSPAWKIVIDQSGLFALVLGFGVFVLVGVWGMRQTLACVGGVMLLQVMLLSSAASLAPVLDAYHSTRLLAERIHSFEMNNPVGAGDGKVIAYRLSYDHQLQTLPFYSNRRVAVFGPSDELAFGQEQDPASGPWFVRDEEAETAMLAMPPGVWGVTDADHWQDLRHKAPSDAFQLMKQSGDLLLFQKEH